MDVDECGDCLDLGALLCMVNKVALAGLILGVPFEDVELCAQSKRITHSKYARWMIST